MAPVGKDGTAVGGISEKEVADLTLAVATINAWNRLANAARTEAGRYEPAAVAAR